MLNLFFTLLPLLSLLPLPERVTSCHAQGESQTYPLKFRHGFQRRTGETIGTDADRNQRQYFLEQRDALWAEQKREKALHHFNPNGNVVVGGDALVGQEQVRGRRHADSQKGALSEAEDAIRKKSGDGRFYFPPPDATIARFTDARTAQMRQQASAVLGVGKAAIPSLGVADNFIGMRGYVQPAPPPRGPPLMR